MIQMDRTVTFIHAIVAVFAGYISFILNMPPISFLLAVILLAVTFFSTKIILKINEDKNWWISNAIVVYVLAWFVVWTVFYNIRLLNFI